MPWKTWYDALEKPAWTPEPSTISLIWTLLYPVILVTFGFVFVQVLRRKLPLAALDIAIVWLTILWVMKATWPHHRWIALAQIPYLIWVTIASVLQFTITWNNW